ncbi:hypothetical protein [Azospirillum picis]|uniref:Uncharacterized protein n=1 Tax=Azospirillum picis TaxID=488438 RepID=A0ABU0MTQ9_9PROT|nr:hypothetical protein [Azospirillum picis]MBP2303122.1 hypothetical protein [Azospirillum picis]MDQ0536874.1 hypothetical protein [Azospirillum picis]
MTNAYSQIRHADGRAYYQGSPLTLADAQIMLNDDILRRAVRVGAYLRLDRGSLVLVNGPALRRSVNRPPSSCLAAPGLSLCAGRQE